MKNMRIYRDMNLGFLEMGKKTKETLKLYPHSQFKTKPYQNNMNILSTPNDSNGFEARWRDEIDSLYGAGDVELSHPGEDENAEACGRKGCCCTSKKGKEMRCSIGTRFLRCWT